MKRLASTAEVLVIGAGPTGLTLANEVARRGVTVRVIDASAAPNTQTRALGVQARTLELFEKLDLADAAVARGLPMSQFHVFSELHEILHLDLARLESPYPFLLMLPETEVEELLASRLADFGVQVERRVELIGLRQDPDRVEVELRHGDGTVEQAYAGWLVGCDGAHSTVRTQLGMRFRGNSFEENFAVADLRVDWRLPYQELFAFLNRGKFMTFFPMLGGLHRVAVAYPPHAAPAGEVTLEELQRSLARCGPPGARIAEVRQSSRFYTNQRYVERHREGRVLLAGDAAHVHSVVGAQGMNTGIQDAFNLGWKLAVVIAGRAGTELLDSYAAERGPLAQRLVKGTRRITRITLLHGAVTTALRRNVAPRILGRPSVQKTLAQALAQIDISYHGGHRRADHGVPNTGDRAPDVPARATQHPAAPRLYDLLDRRDHTLLIFPDPTGAPAQSIGDELKKVRERYPELGRIVRVADPAVGSRYGMDRGGLLLVRPDGYIGFRAQNDAINGLIRYLRRTFR